MINYLMFVLFFYPFSKFLHGCFSVLSKSHSASGDAGRSLALALAKVCFWWHQCAVADQHAKQRCSEASGIGWEDDPTLEPLPDNLNGSPAGKTCQPLQPLSSKGRRSETSAMPVGQGTQMVRMSTTIVSFFPVWQLKDLRKYF